MSELLFEDFNPFNFKQQIPIKTLQRQNWAFGTPHSQKDTAHPKPFYSMHVQFNFYASFEMLTTITMKSWKAQAKTVTFQVNSK